MTDTQNQYTFMIILGVIIFLTLLHQSEPTRRRRVGAAH